MKIKVICVFERRSFLLYVASVDTIKDVKDKIQALEGFPADQQCLTLSGRKLENNKTLLNYNIEQDSVLCLSLYLANDTENIDNVLPTKVDDLVISNTVDNVKEKCNGQVNEGGIQFKYDKTPECDIQKEPSPSIDVSRHDDLPIVKTDIEPGHKIENEKIRQPDEIDEIGPKIKTIRVCNTKKELCLKDDTHVKYDETYECDIPKETTTPINVSRHDDLPIVKTNIDNKKSPRPDESDENDLKVKTKHDCNMKKELSLKDGKPKGMHIFIETLTERVLLLTVDELDTISKIKSKIEISGISKQQQFLYFNDIFLDDTRTLLSYHIFDKCSLQLIHPYPTSMNIFVRYPSGRTITLIVEPSNSIEDVKRKIESKERIPVDQQRLIYAGKQIIQNDTLLELKIVAGSVLYIVPIRQECFQVYVKFITGKIMSFKVKSTDKVRSLKNLILDKIMIEPNVIQLIFLEQVLDDDNTLEHYNIQKESTLFLSIKCRKCKTR